MAPAPRAVHLRSFNGYSIIGPTVCSGGPPVTSCTPTGTGDGIDGNANITIANGTVQGMGGSGLFLGVRARVKEVRAVSNGFLGIATGFEATITASTAINNGAEGVSTGGASALTGNVVEGNTGNGSPPEE